MAIDFPASPTNGQTFTSGSVTYTWDGTKWTAVAAGGGSSDKITEGNTTAEVIDTGSDGRFVVTTEGTEALRVDSSRRLLLGTSSSRGGWFNTSGQDSLIQTETTTQNIFSGVQNSNNALAPWILLGKSRGTTAGAVTVVQNDDPLGGITFQGADGTEMVEGCRIQAYVDGTPGANDLPTRLTFSTTADGASSPTERMRITEAGRILLGATSPSGANEQVSALSTETRATFVARNTNASLQQDIVIVRANRTTTDGTFKAYSYYNDGAGAYRFYVLDSGNVLNTNNSYAGISDIKLKENIVDASSQWDDIKLLQVRNYNFKVDTGHPSHRQLGLIAQEVELVSPGLVSESPDRDLEGNDLGTVTKSVNYSVLYMKAVKALQEAMERIETLEAKVAALESA